MKIIDSTTLLNFDKEKITNLNKKGLLIFEEKEHFN